MRWVTCPHHSAAPRVPAWPPDRALPYSTFRLDRKHIPWDELGWVSASKTVPERLRLRWKLGQL